MVPVEFEKSEIGEGVFLAIKNKLPIFVIINGLGLLPIELTICCA